MGLAIDIALGIIIAAVALPLLAGIVGAILAGIDAVIERARR